VVYVPLTGKFWTGGIDGGNNCHLEEFTANPLAYDSTRDVNCGNGGGFNGMGYNPVNQKLYAIDSGNIYIIDPTSASLLETFNSPQTVQSGPQFDTVNNRVFVASFIALFVYDESIPPNQIAYHPWPGQVTYVSPYQIVYCAQNGLVYGVCFDLTTSAWTIQSMNPNTGAATVLGTLTPLSAQPFYTQGVQDQHSLLVLLPLSSPTTGGPEGIAVVCPLTNTLLGVLNDGNEYCAGCYVPNKNGTLWPNNPTNVVQLKS
jgi:hypothetical protein